MERGDTEAAAELAGEIQTWRHLFSAVVIKESERCLRLVTGEDWKYFSTKGGFLSGDDARAEQEFIDGAAGRIATKNQEMELQQERLQCEMDLAKWELELREAEYRDTKLARDLEVARATRGACEDLFDADSGAALTNAVCNELFQQTGLPGTVLSFDLEGLQLARREYSEVVERKNGAPSPGDPDVMNRIAECQRLFRED